MDNADIMQMSHSVFPGNQCWLHSLFRLEFPRIGLGRCMQMRRLPEVKRPIRHKTLDNPDMIGWVGFFNQQRRRGPRPATTHTPTRTESKKKTNQQVSSWVWSLALELARNVNWADGREAVAEWWKRDRYAALPNWWMTRAVGRPMGFVVVLSPPGMKTTLPGKPPSPIRFIPHTHTHPFWNGFLTWNWRCGRRCQAASGLLNPIFSYFGVWLPDQRGRRVGIPSMKWLLNPLRLGAPWSCSGSATEFASSHFSFLLTPGAFRNFANGLAFSAGNDINQLESISTSDSTTVSCTQKIRPF